MTIYEAILTRRSWRTYNGLRPDEATLRQIGDIIAEENGRAQTPLIRDAELPAPRVVLSEDPSLSGLQGTYGAIRGARCFLILVAGSDEAVVIEAGALMERVILRATQLGLDTCWLGGTFSRARFGSIAGLDDGEEVIAVSPVGHRSPQTRFAERMMQKIVRSSSRKPFNELFRGVNPPDLSVLTRPIDTMSARERMSAIFEMVRHAPSARNAQPWRGACNRECTRAQLSSPMHARLTPVDMGIALAHFMLASEATGVRWHVSLDRSKPDITIDFTRE